MAVNTQTGTLLDHSVRQLTSTTPVRVASVALGVAITAASAQFTIPLPFTAVPITFAHIAALLVAAALGSRLGALTQVLYVALGAAKRAAQEHGSLMPPAHILNAPTKLMKNLGYGKGYEYDHEAEEGFSGQNYFPEAMERQPLYQPRDVGFEGTRVGELATHEPQQLLVTRAHARHP